MGLLRRFNGTNWDVVGGGTPIYQAPSAPVSPIAGDIWVDTATSFTSGSSLLLAEQIVTGSAVTSITFSGLDGNTHGGYIIQLGVLNTSSNLGISLYVNADTTPSNYVGQNFYSFGTIHGTSTYNSASVGNTSNSVNYPMFYDILVDNLNSIVRYISQGYYSDSASYLVSDYNHVLHKTATTNITSLTFTVSSASGIAVGSTFRLYKRK